MSASSWILVLIIFLGAFAMTAFSFAWGYEVRDREAWWAEQSNVSSRKDSEVSE